MFFDDRKATGGIGNAILTSAKSGGIAEKVEEPNRDHEILTHELLNAVHNRDMQGTHDALHALFTHFQARQASEG